MAFHLGFLGVVALPFANDEGEYGVITVERDGKHLYCMGDVRYLDDQRDAFDWMVIIATLVRGVCA